MSIFPTAAHCASWAGLAPGTHEAPVSRKPDEPKGATDLTSHPDAIGLGQHPCKYGYLKVFFLRIRARRGWSKAIVATAHKILVIA